MGLIREHSTVRGETGNCYRFQRRISCAKDAWKDVQEGNPPQLNQANLHPSKHEFKRRPTQLNLSLIGAMNQKKFASNPSPIRIRILDCTSVSIFGITFGSEVQLR